MHLEILSAQQQELLPYLPPFQKSFYLVGGSAISLHTGRRASIDFDLFSLSKLNKSIVRRKIAAIPLKKYIMFEDTDQMHYHVNDVKVTFFQYPYPVEHPLKIGKYLSMPALLPLAAMKAFALGRRAKWKDYVDLFFLTKDYFSVAQISKEAERLFGEDFSEKLFRQQLAFHADIDYSEEVNYMAGFEVPKEKVKNFLIEKAIELRS
jgi:hypothetical protein